MNEKCCWAGTRHKSRTGAKRQESDMRQNEGWGSNHPLRMQELQSCINWGETKRYRITEAWNESFVCAGRLGRLYFREFLPKHLQELCHTQPRAPMPGKQAGMTARGSLGQPRKTGRIWEERFRALSFSTAEIEQKTSSKQVRKVNLSYLRNWDYWKARQRRRWECEQQQAEFALLEYNLLKNTLATSDRRWEHYQERIM